MNLNLKSTAAIAITFRVLVAVSTRTFFQPDEFFQSLEVAHHAVFGYGQLTWEWTTFPPIRSIVYPSIFVPVYWILKVTGLDTGSLLVIAPKVLQGVLASGTDIGVWLLAERVLGSRYSNIALFLSMTSVFHFLSLSRTLSNSLETSLTTVALCFWPLDNQFIEKCGHPRLYMALTIAALACMVRPTSAILWMFLSSELFWHFRHHNNHQWSLIYAVGAIGLVSGLILTAADSIYYGRMTFTPVNFLRTNMSAVSLFYGRSPWHFYITQALPILTITSLPFFIIGAWTTISTGSGPSKRLLALVIWTILFYSFGGHKEWRFIHPILPAMHVISSKALVDLYYRHQALAVSSRPSKARPHLPIRGTHSAFILLGAIPAIYVLYFHGHAQISVMHYLRSLKATQIESVGFLMPCHSTPLHAYLHQPHLSETGRVWSIGCEPPLAGEELSDYRDQSDIFYDSPAAYLREHFPKSVNFSFPPAVNATRRSSITWNHEWPSHIVLFGALLDESILYILHDRGYRETWAQWNGWEEDWRRRGGVRVWAWRKGTDVT
ncbi:glycosyltransferase family 22 protein [Rickenella mellea]|uniref:Mannosyltransferase n=1 Tax=Rickenella mellea TaxID=50990 RepID=A0A4Y7QIF2_9AGAM|nr:glycosyltransferase family 22 protein [Rickenella mellea]